MADSDDADELAGEYVLGTLDRAERDAVDARLAEDARLKAAVGAWGARLQPLADLAGEATPPASLWGQILARIRSTGDLGRVLLLERAVRRWRTTSGMLAATAAILGLVVIGQKLITPPLPPQASFVAVLGGEGGKPAFVAAVDTVNDTIRLRRVGDAPPPDKSYEIWQVPATGKAVSLGVADNVRDMRALKVSLKEGETIAVSVEPKGGSPTGETTGPVVYTGQLLPAD